MKRTDEACLEILDRFDYDELLIVVVFLIRHIDKARSLSSFEVGNRIIKRIQIYEMNRRIG
jgi:hypothetical protein